MLTLHDGLRWSIGVDWITYNDFWNTLDSLDNYIFSKSQLFSLHVLYIQDPFYVGFVRFIHDNISNNYTIYLLIFSFHKNLCFYRAYNQADAEIHESIIS